MSKNFGKLKWSKEFKVRNTYRRVSGNTNILTKNGNQFIKSLVGKEVETWNGKQWTKVTPFQTSENEQLYKITLSNGEQLNCTFDYQWLIKNHRNRNTVIIETKDLKVGYILEKWELPDINGVKTNIEKNSKETNFYNQSIKITNIELGNIEDTYSVDNPMIETVLFNNIMTR